MGDNLYELALFAGAGGGILGGRLLGWRTVAAVEIEEYPRRVLLQRQQDGILEKFPIWDNVCTFTKRNNACRRFIRDLRKIRGQLVISGGFPCQDISSAGGGKGIRAGERSGLWKEYKRIIAEVRPEFIFTENSPMLTSRGLDIVLQDLAALGYDARWCVLGAWHVGGNHERERLWLLAYANGNRKSQSSGHKQKGRQWPCYGRANVSNATQPRLQGRGQSAAEPRGQGQQGNIGATPGTFDAGWWAAEPAVGRMAHGVARRMDRIKTIGNGQVPLVAAVAFCVLSEGLL